MISKSAAIALISLVAVISAGTGVNCSTESCGIELPPGFTLSIYAANVPNARSMALSPGGTLFVGTRKLGKVYALPDRNGDYRADEVITLARGLNMPNGVAFRDGDLYVAEVHRVIRFKDIERRLRSPGEPEVVSEAFPDKRWHGWKFIRFGPDGRLYVPVGAPCNVCESDDPRFAAILRMNAEGGNPEIFARGVRNTVGFDWHPVTKELWFTDNGRDWLGDDLPPDELNRAGVKGLHFGFPYLHGQDVPDPSFGGKVKHAAFTKPALEHPAHVAPLGMRFYTGRMFPAAYRNQIFIAEHGSWNRSSPIGYRIALARFTGEGDLRYEVFASGWLKEDKVMGRPVDLEVMPDGSLLVSDDHRGAIYRIVYRPGKPL